MTKKPKKMAKKPKKIDNKYDLYQDIRTDKTYQLDTKDRNKINRRYVESHTDPTTIKKSYLGQLCYFKYYTPKTKEDLEYYDAKPVVLIFGKYTSKEGQELILGFNIHYYPPRIRYQVMSRIFKIFKEYYIKTPETGLDHDISSIHYQYLKESLAKAKLDFGVREYIPRLIKEFRVVPTELFKKAIMTEGVFKKKTQVLIMKYWKSFHAS